MSQHIPIDNPMGNCLTCYKVPPPCESQTAASLEKDSKEGECGVICEENNTIL